MLRSITRRQLISGVGLASAGLVLGAYLRDKTLPDPIATEEAAFEHDSEHNPLLLLLRKHIDNLSSFDPGDDSPVTLFRID